MPVWQLRRRRGMHGCCGLQVSTDVATCGSCHCALCAIWQDRRVGVTLQYTRRTLIIVLSPTSGMVADGTDLTFIDVMKKGEQLSAVDVVQRFPGTDVVRP